MTRLFFLAALLAAPAVAGWSVDLEAGPAFCQYNDVQIPTDSGTRFSLVDDLAPSVALGLRARVSRTFGNRHWVSLLAAPLRLTSRGSFDRPVLFYGTTFGAGEEVAALYRFDSYRLTWRYALVRAPRFRLELGLTAKVRSAEIALESAGEGQSVKRAARVDLGFVPLIGFRAEWRPARRLALVLDGDALGAPQGRAEDVLAALQFGVGDRVDARVGYRLLEGGGSGGGVYSFAMFHYAVAGLTLRL